MNTVNVDLGAVQTTLLIPLLGRAEETQKRRGLLHDPKAVEIVDALDYDFGKWKGTRSLLGASLRTSMFDEDVREFLDAHPDGTVVEIGCGLNTRFDRVDNGRVRWFDLDLPDSIALRRRFFEDRPRCTMLASSVLDDDWMDEVAQSSGPVCFVSEAVLIYLEQSQVREAISTIAARFAGAWILTDTTPRQMVDNQGTHDAMRHLSSESWFRWACDEPATIAEWAESLSLVHSRSFLDAPDHLRRRLPLPLRLFLRFAPAAMTRKLSGYRLNRFEVAGEPGLRRR
ncbi:MAG: class I SAM-dependent methyltransferase [Myxococcota bacterium]